MFPGAVAFTPAPQTQERGPHPLTTEAWAAVSKFAMLRSSSAIPPREITGDHPDFGKQEPILAREGVK